MARADGAQEAKEAVAAVAARAGAEDGGGIPAVVCRESKESHAGSAEGEAPGMHLGRVDHSSAAVVSAGRPVKEEGKAAPSGSGNASGMVIAVAVAEAAAEPSEGVPVEVVVAHSYVDRSVAPSRLAGDSVDTAETVASPV